MGDPFFDLGNFSINHELIADRGRGSSWRPTRATCRPARLARLTLMRVVSDFREAMWGVLQQGVSSLDVDFVAYAAEHFDRLLANASARRPSSGPSRRRRRLSGPGARAGAMGPGARRRHRWRDHRLQRRLPPRRGRLDGRPPRREGAADRRLDVPGGRPRDGVQPVLHDDGVPPLQHRAVRAARRLRARSAACASRRPRSSCEELERTASRARGIGLDVGVIGAG